MSQENVQAAQEAYKAFGQGDIAGAVAGMDENAEWVTSDELPLGGTLHGREEIAQAFARIPEYFDEFSVEPDEFIDAGDVVIVHAPNALAPLNPLRYADFTHVRAFTVGSLAQLFRLTGLTPRVFRETAPRGSGPAATLRRALWRTALRPLVKAWMLVANGDAMGGIYTANVLAVAERAPEIRTR